VQAGSPGSTEQLGTGAFTLIDHTGGETIGLGTGAQTVIGSSGDTIVGGDATHGRQEIDMAGRGDLVNAGPMTAIGGAGPLIIEAGSGDSIVGGTGPTTVFGGGRAGPGRSFGGDNDGNPHRGDGERDHGRNDDGFGGGTVSGGPGRDRHDDQSGAGLFGNDTIVAGSGPMTVFGGGGDSITGGSGALLVDINSQDRVHGKSPSIAGSGSEMIDLTASSGAATLRDVSVAGGSGDAAATTVMGFSDAEVIASKTSVSHAGEFLGTSSVSGGSTILTFTDGSTMTLAGITDLSQVHFTR
jgi:hypothetical protein